MGVSGALSLPRDQLPAQTQKAGSDQVVLGAPARCCSLRPASCTQFCPTHLIHASLYSSISNRELWHKDIRLGQKASWGFMRWGPTTGQCQAQGAMLWIIVRPSCQVLQKGIFFFFFPVACFLTFKEKSQGTWEASTCGSCWSWAGSRLPPRLLLLQHCCLCWHFLSFGYVCMTLCPQNMSVWCTVEEWHNFYQGEI